MSPAGRATAAVAVWMATWWLTEAVPLAVTALLPLVLFPLLGAVTVAEAAAPYSRPLIYFFMGGFILGLGLQRWGVHRRLALLTLLAMGTEPVRLVAGFMLATAVLSMWISNTAAVIMLLPIGRSILETYRQELERGGATPDERGMRNFGLCLMLGIAYAASIGGMGTLIGTPPNLILAAFLEDTFGRDLSMAEWFLIGLPLVVVLLPLTWLYLTRLVYPVRLGAVEGGAWLIRKELEEMGRLGRGERIVITVFTLTALGWVFRPQLVALTGLTGLNDAVIAMAGALSLFIIPVERKGRVFAMDWKTASALPWDILILFGGGLSLASAMTQTGVATFLASGFDALTGVPPLVLILAVTGMVVFLTEITSNTAVTTTLLPVLAAAAAALGTDPGPVLTAAALAASCAFMLPVATPPNALVFSSGVVTVADMVKAGIGLNLLAILLISLMVSLAEIGVGL